ncbi:MAG: Spermidine N(1)-acetyltransferase [Eubacterium sp.]|uniref:GNAT family N-acetyltransferase n=1 Tax=Eubacterium sp. TaxID=142586 RepID=UPI00303C60DA
MRLRYLETKDAPYMLEWMHDPEINKNFRFNANAQTIETVQKFTESAQSDNNNKHFAIVNDGDEYQGTVSLKNIDLDNLKAEYAICLRKCAQGNGTSKFATEAILNYGFYEINLNRIYLNVLSENIRANRFYQKFGFVFEGETMEDIIIGEKKKNLKWYRILKNEYLGRVYAVNPNTQKSDMPLS